MMIKTADYKVLLYFVLSTISANILMLKMQENSFWVRMERNAEDARRP